MISTEPFIGRKAELTRLKQFLHKKTASLIVIRGRRRIGKSRLVEEFAKGLTFYSFAGLAPTKETTAQSQRDVFAEQLSERKGPLTDHSFRKIVTRAGEVAKLSFNVHPHMLRHATGFKLANDGIDTRSIQHYLGHKSIRHTTRYTELASDRFKNFWTD